VEFTARQYYYIYKSRFEENKKMVTVVNTSIIWASEKDICCTWGGYS